MVFSSLFFLCVFLPVTLILYFAVNNRNVRNWILIAASVFFYAWGEPVWVTVLLFSTFLDYYCALQAEKNRGDWRGKAAVAFAVTANLFILGFFKYSGFIADNINALLGTSIRVPGLNLPIGISFYTFQLISYVVDVYRGESEAQKSPFKLLLYISLFPQLVAGPIVRYQDIAWEIENRTATVKGFNNGVNRFIIGLGKKVIIANTAGEIAGNFLNTDYSRLPVLGAWFGIAMFALQIYFDFSGYSDMAIGLGKMFGFTYKENFNYPYISKSATEFWRRWHISLGTFFRDYVYIPLGGNRKHQTRNLFFVWFLTGLWHGASWNFIIWGLFYFVLIFLEKKVLLDLFNKLPVVFSRIYLLLAVLVGWVFFYHTDLGQAFRFLGIMFGINAASWSNGELYIHFTNNATFFAIAVIASTPLAKKLYESMNKRLKENLTGMCILDGVLKSAVNILILVVSIIFLVGQSYNPFLYFRF
ncbi:MAG TPA: MBOAT family protein [Clostridiaceae bacterium]|nr:MBOAT family protein [Clostridiaceae bacterium]